MRENNITFLQSKVECTLVLLSLMHADAGVLGWSQYILKRPRLIFIYTTLQTDNTNLKHTINCWDKVFDIINTMAVCA